MTPIYLFSETKRHAVAHKHFGNNDLTCRQCVFACECTPTLVVADECSAKGIARNKVWLPCLKGAMSVLYLDSPLQAWQRACSILGCSASLKLLEKGTAPSVAKT